MADAAGPILTIRMQSGMVDCWICGEPTEYRWGVPTCNGDLVSNDFPDDLWEGGQAVCESCFAKHARGELPTFDRYYVRRGPLGVDLIHGGGI